MDKAVEQEVSTSRQTISNKKPVVKLARNISEWTKTFFTLSEEEKDAAGICDYKKNNHTKFEI